MDTYDITGMDAAGAKEYVLAAISTLTQTRAKREELEREEALWSKRVELAKEHGRTDLHDQSGAKLIEVKEDLERIKLEEAELNGGVIRLKGQLKLILGRPELSMDADQLAAELELMAEEKDDLAERFKEEEANDALAQLKAQVEKEEKKQ
ncbi:MAG: hypothetical protein HN368_14440 [Spirochaetales bacterium]|jgi:hypothetical protein|nr:hypothetical protein [Spirochaetales bacterium]